MKEKIKQRQDFVDNNIHQLLEDVTGMDIPWDIEFISIIREALEDVVVNKIKAMTSQNFYPNN